MLLYSTFGTCRFFSDFTVFHFIFSDDAITGFAWLIKGRPAISRSVEVVAFSSRARILGEYSIIHPPPALFFVKWRLARAHQFHSLGQDQSTLADSVN